MDPLRAAIALQIGQLTLDAIEAKTQLAAVKAERDRLDALKGSLEAELQHVARMIKPPADAKPRRGRKAKTNGAAPEQPPATEIEANG